MSPWDAVCEKLRDLGWWLRCRLQRRLPPMRVHIVGGRWRIVWTAMEDL